MSEAIKEVEKLQAAQQITSTPLPTSLVNTMSSDNDRCFQCQEVGHMAHYCPHIWCYNCNDYGHVAMDCPDKILPLGTPATAGLTTMTGAGDPPPDVIVTPDIHTMTTETYLNSVTLGLAPVTTTIEVVATRTLTEATPDHSTGLPITTSHETGALAPAATATIHLTTDLHLTGIPHEMTADLDIDLGNNTTNQPKDLH